MKTMTSRLNTDEIIQSKEDIERLFVPILSSPEFRAKSLSIFEITKSNHAVYLIYCDRIDTLVEFLSKHTKKAYPISSSILAGIFVFVSLYNRFPDYEVPVLTLKRLPAFQHTRFGNAVRIDLLDNLIFITIQVKLSTKLDIRDLDRSLNSILATFHKTVREYRTTQPFYDKIWLICYIKLKKVEQAVIQIGERSVRIRENFIRAGCHYGIITVEVESKMSEMSKDAFVSEVSKTVKQGLIKGFAELSDEEIIDLDPDLRPWKEAILEHYDRVMNYVELENLRVKHDELLDKNEALEQEIRMLKEENRIQAEQIKSQAEQIKSQAEQINNLLKEITELKKQ